MADRYWVGGGSANTWAATGNTNWSATSGGANNASVPGTTDVAIFDANSGVGNSVISANITVQKLICTNYAGTLTHNTGVTLTLNTGAADTLILGASMTYTPSSATAILTFTNTSGTADITSNGKRVGSITVNGVGGTVRLLDAVRIDTFSGSTLTITNGTFDANGFNVTINLFSSSNSNTRTVTMGSGTWTVAGGVAVGAVTIWAMSTQTGLTFNKNTAPLVIPSSGNNGTRSFLGVMNFNNITIQDNSAGGSVTFNSTLTAGAVTVGFGNNLRFPGAGTVTMTDFDVTGTLARPCLISSDLGGSIATISIASGTATMSYVGLRDITGSGGATFVATNAFDFGGNTNIAITAPAVGATAAEVATAVWDAATRTLTAIDEDSTTLDLDATIRAAVGLALNTDTYAEPGQGTPGATISLADKIGYLYKFLRNKKTITATTFSLFNDDAATVDQKSTLSDVAGTYTETEKTTGP